MSSSDDEDDYTYSSRRNGPVDDNEQDSQVDYNEQETQVDDNEQDTQVDDNEQDTQVNDNEQDTQVDDNEWDNQISPEGSDAEERINYSNNDDSANSLQNRTDGPSTKARKSRLRRNEGTPSDKKWAVRTGYNRNSSPNSEDDSPRSP